ncbi:MAG: NAD(P)H-dependent oxidoreductase [Candidatus Eisenbacteria bacterium]|uniref:NAD(P)H-dependent oxidoreductase n=1 Tax=Eiseniibacteriota bacterium TaxID=2212470 RepID=A0A7Y2E6D7_UNCEI|nr:NAD(P)H-dependent oxidoreductase [Candidatus Eisenbacteria bacterium]
MHILAFSGSNRKDSFNQRLVAVAARGAQEAGVDTTIINLGDFSLPIYCQDLQNESGLPPEAQRLKNLFKEADGFLIASPEYNSAFSPLLKNAIDWVSRSEGKDDPAGAAFAGKSAVLMAASPGALGGLRGLVFLRMLLGNIGITVLPNQRAIPKAADAFLEDGNLRDEKVQASILNLGGTLAQHLQRLES